MSDEATTKLDRPPVGLLVRFEPEGPPMRVIDHGTHTGRVWCLWMTPAGDVREASFDAAVLRPWRDAPTAAALQSSLAAARQAEKSVPRWW